MRVVHSLAVHVGDRVRSLLQRCKRRCARVPSAVVRPMQQACARVRCFGHTITAIGSELVPLVLIQMPYERSDAHGCSACGIDAQPTIGGDDSFGRQKRR